MPEYVGYKSNLQAKQGATEAQNGGRAEKVILGSDKLTEKNKSEFEQALKASSNFPPFKK